MTKETRIGLVVGLGFIILFGLVLSELTGTAPGPPQDAAAAHGTTPYAWTTPQPVPQGPEPISALAAGPAPSRIAAERGLIRSEMRPPAEMAGGTVRATVRPSDMPAPAEIELAAVQPEAVRAVAEAPARERTYTVQSNDSLIRIARKMYGEGHDMEYKRIFEANRDQLSDPSMLVVGQVLKIPALADGAPAPPRAAPPRRGPTYVEADLADLGRHLAEARAAGEGGSVRIYVVRRGDSLSKIAKQFLNDDSHRAVQRLYEVNRDKLRDPDLLPVGVELKIPS